MMFRVGARFPGARHQPAQLPPFTVLPSGGGPALAVCRCSRSQAMQVQPDMVSDGPTGPEARFRAFSTPGR
jgi:hypothetical protein